MSDLARPRKKVDLQKVIELYRAGYSTSKIEEMVGVSHDTILRRLKEAGHPIRRWRLPGEK